MIRRFARIAALLALLQPVSASAHKPSDSYMTVHSGAGGLELRWDIALRDLEHAIGLDRDGDAAITWGEMRERIPRITAYAMKRLRVAVEQGPCALAVRAVEVDRHTDGTYAALRIAAACPGEIRRLDIAYDLFFDLDPQHRGIVTLTGESGVRKALFSPERRAQRFALAEQNSLAAVRAFWRDGLWHIWWGVDHILFLLALLLPAVLRREHREWRGVERFPAALHETVRIVSAFTVAHSVTLGLAVLRAVELPSRLVESGIAASVMVAAFDNLRPVFGEKRWRAAFAFGLLHGFGFASVLAEPDLPGSAIVCALLGFNLGVECGQLVIVSLFLPVAFVLRRSWFYRRVALQGGAAAVIALAGVWLVERALDLQLL